jgi:predicted transcriptional regulator
MANFSFKFVFSGIDKSINCNESGDTIGQALDKVVKKFGLENETFGVSITPLSTVYVPKGSFVNLVV